MAAAPSLISSNELMNKMNALLNDPTYELPDNVSDTDRNWIRTGINMMAQDLPNPAISVQHAISRTFRAPHGGRKSRNQKKRQSRRKQSKQRSRRSRSFRR